MRFSREPRIHPVAIDDLRPTQITVGMREVEAKRVQWREHNSGTKADFLGAHLIPVVRGPRGRPYLVDHHHLVRALHDEGVKEIAISVTADLSKLDPATFWVYLDNRAWMHPYDAEGVRQDYKKLPKHIEGLIDDPYRSLAGELRWAGGFAKDTTPFAEFLWADFLRRQIKRKMAAGDPVGALDEAVRLAKSGEADYLPGWCGPVARG